MLQICKPVSGSQSDASTDITRFDFAGCSDDEYLLAYRQHTNQRVLSDPEDAVGGRWDEIGLIQFNFLKTHGLQPHHRLLDVGCGTLRGGLHFIDYLDPINYVGIEMSDMAVEYCRHSLERTGRSVAKHPSIIHNPDGSLQAVQHPYTNYEYILAQSVFTHLPPATISQHFASLKGVMHNTTRFFFTYFDGPVFTENTPKNFVQPFSFYKTIADDLGLVLCIKSDYPHPRGQVMVEAYLQ